ncbi:Ent-kaur-16-ene synthase [Citrus sinensis]|uniref:Ent-kaur-16-ene synthase n=2 Tax=Citrus sinensis TaxID=2711 RepID=A0ACB8HQK4_CITSI|nr:Ent-kaur-16-ene synthase [Citrus sinensis]
MQKRQEQQKPMQKWKMATYANNVYSCGQWTVDMALSRSHNLISSSSLISGTANHGSKFGTEAKTNNLCFQRTKERIEKMFDKIELSFSPYDTAWVAMVPSLELPQAPCFPQCINWLLDNQVNDGSWGLHNRPSWLVKDAVLCTLACVLALKRWGIGEEQMNKGIQFIMSNFASVTDEKQQTPIGFDIIFPGMIECAQDLNLNLPLRSSDINAMLERRHLELNRNYTAGRKEYLAYVSEGIGKLQDWEMGEEEIFLDLTTCAMAFRLLRLNGYDVSSDPLTQFAEDNQFCNSLKGYLKDISAVLELYRASQITIYPDESVLEKQQFWTSHFLKQELSSGSIHSNRFSENDSSQVEDALKFPYHVNLERLAHRRNINLYNVDNMRILKTSYCSLNIGNEYFQKLAVDDFNICQSMHIEELKHLERWVVEKRLDKLKFARQKQTYCYFSVAATLFSPELSDARMSWAKNAVLTTIVDDFYDLGGSEEELLNLIDLLERWDVEEGKNCCSEQVEIIFSALRSTICEFGDKTLTWQGRNATSHIVETSMFKETKCLRNKSVPTLDEYMENAYASFALGPIIFPAVYFVGPKLSEEVVRDPEFHNLYKLVSTCGRLLNDIQGFKRESKEGKLNSVSLQMTYSDGNMTEVEAIEKIKVVIKSTRRELLRLVLKEEGSIVPRACKDLIWKMSKVLHLFYMNTDGFSSNVEMVKAVSEVVYEPISVNM